MKMTCKIINWVLILGWDSLFCDDYQEAQSARQKCASWGNGNVKKKMAHRWNASSCTVGSSQCEAVTFKTQFFSSKIFFCERHVI